jgi:hypothetical protein
MLVAGGSVYEGEHCVSRQPRVRFSRDGGAWSAPERVLGEGDWLWRVTWHGARAYGVTYTAAGDDWAATLVSSADGRRFEPVTTFAVHGLPNEATVRVLPDGEMVALLRREGGTRFAWVGRSRAPYTEWSWHDTQCRIGGPNFIRLPDGQLWGGGRIHADDVVTALGRLTPDGSFRPSLTLPSGGDTGYPGLQWFDETLYVSYYSSHEGRASIYLARVKFQ